VQAATALIHHPYQPPAGFEAPLPGVFKASTVFFPNVAAMREREWKNKTGYTYGLHGTPTTYLLEERLATLEGGTQCLLAPSGLAALFTVALALLLAFARRQTPTRPMRSLVGLANLGYALPGSVLAVSIMLAFSYLDNQLVIPLSTALGGAGKPLLLGSLAALLLAYVIRFMAVAYGPLEGSLARIRPSLPEASRSLGAGGLRLFGRVYLPLLLPGVLSAALLVFVDVLKEMPATLLMRPFGWDTLAVRVFEMTSEGEWARASLPALSLVLVGLLPVILLIRRSARRPGH